MKCEYAGRYDEATDIYNSLLQKDPCDGDALKRKACICISQGNLNQAIRLLTDYVGIFPKDDSVWQQLAELYIETDR